MTVVTPFWFKQRQAKAEEVGPDLLRVSGPNLKEGFVGIRRAENGLWSAFLRFSAEDTDIEATPPALENGYHAWEAAFEMYRKQTII